MGRFRRTRGNKGVWFPVNGEIWNNGEQSWYDAAATLATGFVGTDRATGPSQIIIPVTSDQTVLQGPSPPVGIQSLRDIVEGQNWLLKTLVGNCTVIVNPSAAGGTPYTQEDKWLRVHVGAGFFVARAQDDDPTFPDLTFRDVDVLDSGNTQNPWIWRRTWILDNPANYIETETGHVTVWDTSTNRELTDPQGPFFMTKSVRRIRREERLWFTVGAIGWDGERPNVNAPQSVQPSVSVHLDLRIFGKMMRGKNASAF